MTNFSSVSEDGEEGLCFVGQLSLGCLMSIFGGMLCESILKARPEIGLACGALAGIYLYHHFVHWTSFAQCAAMCGVSSILACIIFPEDIVVEALLTTFPAAAVAAASIGACSENTNNHHQHIRSRMKPIISGFR